MSTRAVVPAAGRGVRMGATCPKQFMELQGKPILAWTLEALMTSPRLDGIVVVAPAEQLSSTQDLVAAHLPTNPRVQWVAGGKERQDSVYNGLLELPADCEWVLIHDGVRPFVTPALIERTLAAAQKTGAALCALPATDTVKRVRWNTVIETLPREEIWLVQTPQVFRRWDLIEAHRKCREKGWQATDDATLMERLGFVVGVVSGEPTNRKITTPDDLEWARWVLTESGLHTGVTSAPRQNCSAEPICESVPGRHG